MDAERSNAMLDTLALIHDELKGIRAEQKSRHAWVQFAYKDLMAALDRK